MRFQLTQAEIREIQAEIDRLKECQADAVLQDDLHAVNRIHNRLVKLQKLLQEEK